jgi:hypothetical protein
MRTSGLAVLLTGALGLGGHAAQADVPCPGFSWDVSAEHALFMNAPTALQAGTDRASAPVIEPNRLVALELKPAGKVTFAAPPAKAARASSKAAPGSAADAAADTFAGLAIVRVPRSGNWRISVNQSAWIDVVSQGQRVAAVDYEGSRTCDAPHKVVVFPLTAGKAWVVQLSAAMTAAARVTVTPAPPVAAGS